MKQRFKTLIGALLALCLLFGAASALGEGDNLIVNGDFSTYEGDLPEGWQKEMWYTDTGISLLTVEADGWDGACVSVSNVDENDARYAQKVAVKPNTLYRLSGRVKAAGCDTSGYGATLSIGSTFVYSRGVYDSHGEWQSVELYGRTGPKQKELTVFLRVGGYGSLSRGQGWFDDIALTAVDEAPAGVVVRDFFKEETKKESVIDTSDNGAPERFTETWLLLICLYCLAVVALARKRGRSAPESDRSPRWPVWFTAAMAAALALRLFLAMRVPGYHTDIGCFTSWSERIFSGGLLHFYDPEYFCDYPPGYMLLLWPVALARRALGISTGTRAYLAILKLLPILTDMAGAILLWRVARRHFSDAAAASLGVLYAFNPAAIVNSAAWGQIDAVLTLALALCALSAVDGHYLRAMLWFAAALLLKPQALLFAPVGLVAIAASLARLPGEKRGAAIRQFALGVVACLGILYAAAFLFCFAQSEGLADKLTYPVRWLYSLYAGTMQSYSYITVNTLNLPYLLGMNWARTGDHPVMRVVCWAAFAASYLYAMALTAAASKRPRRLFVTGALVIVLVCVFGPMIHERYIFPGVLLLALAFAVEKDVRLLISLTALTATLFLNEALVLQGGMTAANYGHLQSSEMWLNAPLCILNVLNALLLGWTAFDICVRDHVMALKTPAPEEIPAGEYTLNQPADYRMNLRRVDALIMAAVTLVYGVVAFVNLGDTRAPQTGWVSSIGGESVVFDLGEVQTFRMTYYGGICNTAFGVELSNDGAAWTDMCYAKYNQGEIFRWIWFVPQDENQNILYGDNAAPDDGQAHLTHAERMGEAYPFQTARYIRLTAQSAGLTLFEVGFLDADGDPLPIRGVSQSGQTAESLSSAALLIDEQNTVASKPSYLNSTYFDEIYHARTAYEQVHSMNAYEWTHPPLGKATMMLGIELFGMTPFGWRFMGTLFGVMMLPLMYLLVKQLTKSTPLSAVAMGLMALDAMHFTQTRIATIDSYAVFWIMLMYLFMFRYCQMSWNREPLRRTLVPLGLCGVTMGVAWATKWIGIYASAGLAILFFWTVFRRLREDRYLHAGQVGWGKLLITLGFCVAFFVVIPVLIYYFSYAFQLRGEGVRHLGDMFSMERVRRVIKLQKDIFNYHSGLGGDTHYFRSPWYQWPVIWWPMWYYSGTAYMPEGVISSISCMGNPAVWWFGLGALIFLLVRMAWVRRAPKAHMMTLIGFASQFLPWVIVPRSTFIYHYFASVPFIIIASVLVLELIRKKSDSAFRAVTISLLCAALVLFVMFYPLESGMPVARSYAQLLRWFKWYNF